jgi:sulfur-carrier protein
MKNPMPINLMTSEEVRAAGWQAEARDADGHLISMHAPFSETSEIDDYIREAIEHGETVTIWPVAKDGPHP